MENNNPFEQAENCMTKAQRVTSKSDCSVNYMLVRTLSMSPATFWVAASTNEVHNRAPAWAVRMYAHTVCPSGRPIRAAFVKKTKSAFTEKEQRIIGELAKVLHVSPRHAEESYLLMKEQKVNFDAIFGQKIVGAKK